MNIQKPASQPFAFSNARALTRMTYGVVCFATLLSFVGTVLGGIWADESWGRFWGWDPKENGALLIVVWNALILHARWAGLVKGRGLANLAIFGNCVCAWSWFGTNMLGVGLHSYGRMDEAMFWLMVFVLSQVAIIFCIGCLPLDVWKNPGSRVAQPEKVPAWLPWTAAGVTALCFTIGIIGAMGSGEGEEEFHYREFSNLPVQDNGRIMPFDTFARIRLMQVSHRMSAVHAKYERDPVNPDREIAKDEVRLSPTQWALDTMLAKIRHENDQPNPALSYRVFRIDNDQLVNALKLPYRPGSWRYAYSEFGASPEFLALVKRLKDNKGPNKDDIFENKVAELWQHVGAFLQLTEFIDDARLLPPGEKKIADAEWLPLSAAAAAQFGKKEKAAFESYMSMVSAYFLNRPAEFNAHLKEYQQYLQEARPQEYHAAQLEAFFNRFEPFYHCSIMYGLIFGLGALSWLVWPRRLQAIAFAVALVTLAIHTWAIATRCYLMHRPPITNLYSTAIVIGWGCVAVCLLLEWWYKNGIGIVVAGVTGLLTLIIAHNLVAGDTMDVLEAVLGTNFWLSTHVICINFGYTATFVAGFLGIMYILNGAIVALLNWFSTVGPLPRQESATAAPVLSRS